MNYQLYWTHYLYVATATFLLVMVWKRATVAADDDLASFLDDNGMKYVTVVTNSASTKGSATQNPVIKSIIDRRASYIRVKHLDDFELHHRNNMDSQVFELDLLSNGDDNVEKVLKSVYRTKLGTSILMLRTCTGVDERDLLLRHLRTSFAGTAGSFFFVAVPTDSSFMWYQVIKLRNGCSVDMVAFVPGSFLVQEKYDLQGLEIRSLAIPWPPYMYMEDCDRNGICTNSGYLIDYVDILAKKCNFTYKSFREMGGNWGSVDSDEGIIGRVLSGEFDCSISGWVWTVDRTDHMSFVIMIHTKRVLAWIPQNPSTDFGLFLRPFAAQSWISIFSVLAAALATAYLAKAIQYGDDDFLRSSNGQFLLSITIWYFFVILNAYYSGALTMFFTTKNSIAFEGLNDVLKAFPNWKLIFQEGSEVFFSEPAVLKDPDYARFWSHAQSNPDVTKFETVAHGVQMLKQDKTVMHVTIGVLKAHLNSADGSNNVEVFSSVSTIHTGIMFGPNSPLQRVFKWGSSGVRESGLEYQLQRVKWEGGLGGAKRGESTDIVALSVGHLILAFVFVLGTVAVCGLVLLGEVIYSQVKASPRHNYA